MNPAAWEPDVCWRLVVSFNPSAFDGGLFGMADAVCGRAGVDAVDFKYQMRQYELLYLGEFAFRRSRGDVVAPRGMAVSRKTMSHIMAASERHFLPRAAARRRVAAEVTGFVDGARNVPFVSSTEFASGVCRISEDTLYNTAALIDAGYAVELAEWENLKGIGMRLKAGETVLSLRCPFSADALGGLPIETVYAERLYPPFSRII